MPTITILPNLTNSSSQPQIVRLHESFLEGLAKVFNVRSPSLVTFILILLCLGCLGIILLLFLCYRCCPERERLVKNRHKLLPGLYVDELVDARNQGEYGAINYLLFYKLKTNLLEVDVLKAMSLRSATGVYTVDAYVTVAAFLIEGISLKQIGPSCTSDVQRGTTTVVWRKRCYFSIDSARFKKHVLKFGVFEYSDFETDRSIGQVEVPLAEIDMELCTEGLLERTSLLNAGCPPDVHPGELCVVIAYIPQTSCLEVIVLDAKLEGAAHLFPKNRKCRLTVLIKVYANGRKIGSFETGAKEGDLKHPYFNKRRSFPFKPDWLETGSIRYFLNTSGRFRRKHMIGEVQIRTQFKRRTGYKQWQEMSSSPGKFHTFWHPLLINAHK